MPDSCFRRNEKNESLKKNVAKKKNPTHITSFLLPWWLSGKRICLQCKRPIPGLGGSPGGGYGKSSCLENPMDRGAWWATVHGAAKSQTQLNIHA